MCTAITYHTQSSYFGRTLDYEHSFGEHIVLTPRNYPLVFRKEKPLSHHYGILGMAHMEDDYPLYYDACNEKGLGMAGLNFVGNAVYHPPADNRRNITPFEFIPWILGQCATLSEVKPLLDSLNLLDEPFSPSLPLARLHWMITDGKESLTIESMHDGLHIYANPVGVLTNNPTFPQHLFRLNDYMSLSPYAPRNSFAPNLPLHIYSRGMGALGLPGDGSSQSRFVRAAFTRLHSRSGASETESVNQFFHILGTVEQVRGVCQLDDGTSEITLYTSCCSLQKGIYYYTTYNNHQINAIHMKRESLDSSRLTLYPLLETEQIHCQN